MGVHCESGSVQYCATTKSVSSPSLVLKKGTEGFASVTGFSMNSTSFVFHGTVSSFSGEFRFLSNFFPSPIMLMGRTGADVEHWFQAMKSTNSADFGKILCCESAGHAKRTGRVIAVTPDWDLTKYSVMRFLVHLKFTQNPALRTKLLQTGDAKLVEGNTWHDNIWGVCMCGNHEGVVGQNWLGLILMDERSWWQKQGVEIL